MGSEVGASVSCPSTGSMFRHPLPSAGSARARSPASSVLWNAPTPARPSRRASFPSRDGTAPALTLRSRGPRVHDPRTGTVPSGVPPDSSTRTRTDLPGSWRTLMRTCPALRPRRARHAWPVLGVATRPSVFLTTSALASSYLSRLHHAACTLPVYASQGGSRRHHATLGSGWWPSSAGRDWVPAGFRKKVSETPSLAYISFPFSKLRLAH